MVKKCDENRGWWTHSLRLPFAYFDVHQHGSLFISIAPFSSAWLPFHQHDSLSHILIFNFHQHGLEVFIFFFFGLEVSSIATD